MAMSFRSFFQTCLFFLEKFEFTLKKIFFQKKYFFPQQACLYPHMISYVSSGESEKFEMVLYVVERGCALVGLVQKSVFFFSRTVHPKLPIFKFALFLDNLQSFGENPTCLCRETADISHLSRVL